MESNPSGRRQIRIVGLSGLAFVALLASCLGSAEVRADSPGTTPASADRSSDSIDAYLESAWDEAGIRPSPLASDAEFSRRAYLDLLGRIPNVQEAVAFLESKVPEKRAKLIDHLLDHPDYPKNFANVYTVLLVGRKRPERGVEREGLTTWLRRQFADNRPWDQMARDLIDAEGSSKENGAVNFTLSHLEFGAVPLTSITTRVFLGQQVQCTQCHDHPSNDWKQEDFWGINAFFKGVKRQQVRVDGSDTIDHVELSDEPTTAFASFDRRNGLVGIAFPTFLDGRKPDQGPDVDRREALAGMIASADNLDFARAFVNRTWAHFNGRGFVFPSDDFGPHNPPSHPELLDRMATDFAASGFDVKTLIRRITSSRAYHLTSAATKDNIKDETLFSHMDLKPMTPEQLFDSLLVATSAHKAGGSAGEVDRRRDTWMRQFVVAFGNDEQEESTHFQGTIPQALMMMNGDLMEQALSVKPGSFLSDLRERARLRRGAVDAYVIGQLYLAALSRPPSDPELATGRRLLSSGSDPVAIMGDIFWALLNSNEFVLNH